MTQQDLHSIEKHVGFTVPTYYRDTLLSYPFDADSFANEFILPNNSQEVIELNDPVYSSPDIGKPFFIGSDGGEEYFFVDASKPNSAVFVFELETSKHRQFAPTWAAFLDHIRVTHTEISADEEAQRQRKLTKKWWQFWR